MRARRPARAAAVAAVFGLIAGLGAGAAAQDSAPDRPLSAIDWLSESVAAPDPLVAAPRSTAGAPGGEPPVADSAAVPEVMVLPLGAASPDPIGLLPPSVSGLPRDLWSGSEVAILTALIAAERIDTLPAMRDLLRVLLLAEADPPADADPDGALFLARTDKLLHLGALDPAWELLATSDPDRPAIFRRYFDVALLTGRESEACALMESRPELAPTLSARIFCLAHSGDWPAAALTLNTARALGDVSAREDALLTRFLDPQLFEGLPPLPIPETPTPLDFRMREGVGEALSTLDLPRAFAHADLRPVNGWKARLEAAERLVRVGAVDEAVLLDLYTLQRPAASGGVWDRAEAIQALERALDGGDPAEVAEALPPAWHAMQAARIEVPFARLFAPRLAAVDLEGEAAALAFRIGLLSDDYETFAQGREAADDAERLWIALARGEALESPPRGDPAAAVHAAFDGIEPPARLMEMAETGRLGEALLRAVALFDTGAAGDHAALTQSLAFLRAVGLEDTARRAALQVLLLDRRT